MKRDKTDEKQSHMCTTLTDKPVKKKKKKKKKKELLTDHNVNEVYTRMEWSIEQSGAHSKLPVKNEMAEANQHQKMCNAALVQHSGHSNLIMTLQCCKHHYYFHSLCTPHSLFQAYYTVKVFAFFFKQLIFFATKQLMITNAFSSIVEWISWLYTQ